MSATAPITDAAAPLITNDAVVFGILAAVLGIVFATSHSAHPFWKRFYRYVPALLLCYLIPGLLNSAGVIDGDTSGLYPMARDYLLPAALILLTLSCDLGAVARLGPKAVTLFLAGTVGVMAGAVVSFLVLGAFDPEIRAERGADSVWRGMTTLAGSWIGGGANQAAMKEVYDVGTGIFAKFVAVDVIVANIWMAFLLILAARSAAIDARRGADVAAIEIVKTRLETYQAGTARVSQLEDLVAILAIGFGLTGLAHWMADGIAPWIATNASQLAPYSLTAKFFWVVVLATTFGLLLSFTRARALEGAGASKAGSLCIYVLVATIGMHIDVRTVLSDPELFLLGLIWILVHGAVLFLAAWALKAPVFFFAVGSQANIGAAASAPVVASAFHPSLAPVGVLLAVLGYALGTYCGWLTGQILRLFVTP